MAPSLTHLPQEIIQLILVHTPISDLLQCSRTCHLLRDLCTDPLLHHIRFQQATINLQHNLQTRPSRASISPPQAWIRLTKTNVLSRSISRSLVKIRLNHRLESRPSAHDLVVRAILPEYYAGNVSPVLVQSQHAIHKSYLKQRLTQKLARRPNVSELVSLNIMPSEYSQISAGIIDTRRQVIKATLKDGLRAWVESRGLKAQQRRASECDQEERRTVKGLVRRLTARRVAAELESRADAMSMEKKMAQARWGKALEVKRARDRELNGCSQPTRARVLALKRFWEGMVRTGA